MPNPLLQVKELKVYFEKGGGVWPFSLKKECLTAVDGVNFSLEEGETVAIVGESGCGKSTLARAVMGLLPLRSGQSLWRGRDVRLLTPVERAGCIQMIFQDPCASLNPRWTAGNIIAEPLQVQGVVLTPAQRRHRVQEMMYAVGLQPTLINRYPHEFSGGQCQRIAIARALIVRPKLLICDEPVAALDVSIQAQVLSLLKGLQEEFRLSMLFISHDLAVVRQVADQVIVMYLGHMMENASCAQLYKNPQHPYTKALLAAAPIINPNKQNDWAQCRIDGELPSPYHPPSGCRFRTRCPLAIPQCALEVPPLVGPDRHQVACIRVLQDEVERV